MVSSAIRGVVQTLIAILVLEEVVSYMRWLGILLTVSGGVFYTWIRHLESLRTSPVRDEENGLTKRH
jgi:drug/metabolite transporter (DMT)-like permease